MSVIGVYTAKPEPVAIPNSIINVQEKDINEAKALIDIEVINARDHTNPNAIGKSYLLIRPSATIRNVSNYTDFAFIDVLFDGIERTFMSAKIMANYLTMFPKNLDAYVDNLGYVRKHLDLNKFKFRNMNAILERIYEPADKQRFADSLREKYIETAVNQLPEGVVHAREKFYGETLECYSAYIVPLFRIEIQFMDMARFLFHRMYVHPYQVVEEARQYESEYARISAHTNEIAHSSNSSARVLKKIYTKIDVRHLYAIPSACNELRTEIDRIIRLNMISHPLDSSSTQFTRLIQVNQTTSKAVNAFGENINLPHAIHAVTAAFKCLINVNLFSVHLLDLDASMFSNFYSNIGFFLMQTIIPPNVIRIEQRLKINNLFAYHIVQMQLGIANYNRIQHVIMGAQNVNPLPQFESLNAWYTSHDDELQKIYARAHNVLANQAFDHVRIMIQSYFNNTPYDLNDGNIEVSPGVFEPMSLSTPYLMGRSLNNYDIDTEFNTFRLRRNMYENGALLINNVTRADDPLNMTFITNKFTALANLYHNGVGMRTGGMYMRTPFTQIDVQNILSKMQIDGMESFSMVSRYYNYYLPQYSCSIAADGVNRNINVLYKKQIDIRPKYLFSLCLVLRRDIEINEQRFAPLYSNIKIASELQLFIAFYDLICNRTNNNPRDVATKGQFINIASKLMSIVLGVNNYDPKTAFGYTHADAGLWDKFLASRDILEGEIPLFQAFNMVLNTVEALTRDPIFQSSTYSHFYLVKAAMMGGDFIRGGTIIAASTVRRDQLDVVYTINTPDEYLRLVSSYRNTDNRFGSEFDYIWYNEVRRVENVNMLRASPAITAIRVNMNALCELTMIKEDGTFIKRYAPDGYTIDSFKNNLNTMRDGDIRKPKIFNIPITVILNDIGSGPHRGPWHLEQVEDSILDTLRPTNAIIPFEELNLNTVDCAEFVSSHLENRLVVRKDPYTILSDFNVEFENRVV